MLELEKLVFEVDTSQLDGAVKKIENLATAVGAINKPLTKATDTSKEFAKGASEAASGAEKVTKGLAGIDKTLAKAETKLKILNGEVIQLADGAIQLARGFKASDAAMLAGLKVSGATVSNFENLSKTLTDINKLGGANSLDKSFGNIEKLKRDIEEATSVTKLMSQGFNLTRDQIVGLSRDIESAKQRFSGSDLDTEIAKITQETVQLASVQNKLVADMKASTDAAKAEARALREAEQALRDKSKAEIAAAQKQAKADEVRIRREAEKATKDAAKAVDYLAQAEQRLDASLDKSNAGLNERSTDQLVAYQRALKQSGLAADAAGTKFDTFKKKLDQVAAKERADELRYLSRAISVQMGDVAISLASGMNPLLVMIQQGDQIRGVLDQTGAKGKELTTAMNAAAAQIASGFKNTAFAITSFMGGALAYVGKSLVEPLKALDKWQKAKALSSINTEGMSDLRISRLQKVATLELASAFGTVAKIAGGAAVAAFTAYGVALLQVSKQEEELNKAVNLTGGSLGMTAQIASDMAKELAGARGNIASFSDAITEAAKAGSVTQQNLEAVTSAAVLLKDEAGIAIADTVKEFSKLSEKPTDSLRELAKTTGMIAPEILQVVATLEQQGMKAEAAAIAVRAYSDAMKNSVGNLVAERGALETFFHAISAGAKSMWDSILNVGRKGSIVEQLKNAQGDLAKRVQEGASWYQTEAAYKEELAYLKEIVDSHQLTIDKEKEKGDVKRKNTEYSEWEIKNSNALQKSLTKEQQFAIKQAELERDVAKGIISQAKAAEALVGWKKIILGDDKKSDAEKEAARLLKSYGKELEKAKDAALGATAAQENYTDSQRKMLDLIDNPDFYKYSKQQQVVLLNYYAQGHAVEELARKRKEEADAIKYLMDVSAAYTKQQEESYKTVFDLYKKNDESIKEQNAEIAFQESLLGKTAEQADKLTESHERAKKELAIQKQYEQDILTIKTAAWNLAGQNEANIDYDRMNAEIAALDKNRANQVDNLNKESAIKAAKAYLDEFNKISSGITDSIVTALFEGGKVGRKKLRDMLVEAIRKPITTYVNVVVNEIMGAGLSMLLSAAGLSNNGSTASNALNAISGANSAYNIYNTGVGGSVGSSVNTLGNIAGSAGTSAFGTGMTLSGASATTAANAYTAASVDAYMMGDMAAGAQYGQVASGLQTGSTAGGYASSAGGYAAGAVAGHYAGRAISNGYSAMGGSSGNTAVNLGTAIGAVIAGPIGAAIGGALGGLTNRAFGSRTSTGIQGTFGGASGFQGQEYKDTSYGWLRFTGDTTSMSALDESDRQAIANDFNLIKAGVLDTAKTLGIGANALDGFTKEIRQSLADPEVYKGILDSITEGLAETALGSLGDWRPFQKEGEKASETLLRLSNTLGTTNAVMENLGATTYDFSLEGYAAAENMIAALGGMGKANQKLGNFYNKFFSEEEKNANLVKQMTTEFGKLGKELPTTRDGFKQMVLAAQATGDNQLLNSLLGFTDAMDSIYPVTEKATEGVEDLVSALKTSFTNYSDLQSQITQQENELKLDALNEQLDVVKSLIDAAKGLKEFIKSLKIGDLTILSPEAKLQEAKKQYADTLSKAKAGDEVAMQNLQGVSESYLSIAKDYYGSNAAYAAIFTEVSTGVETLANKTIDSQTKIANSLEKQIKAIETSSKATLDQLKAQLEQAKTQFYQDLSNTAKIVLSNDNVAAVLKTLPPELASALSSALAAAVTPLLKLTMGSNATSAAIAPALASSVGSGQTTLASAVSTSKAIIDALWLPIPMTTMKVNAATGEVKAFADGGYYQGGMALVGEQGPELINFRNPGQVYNNQQTKELLNDSSSSNDEETKVLLRALVTEVKALRNQQGLESSGQVTKLSSIERKLSSIESTGILEKSK